MQLTSKQGSGKQEYLPGANRHDPTQLPVQWLRESTLCRVGIHLPHQGIQVPAPLWHSLPLRRGPGTKVAGKKHVAHSCPSPARKLCSPAWGKGGDSIFMEILRMAVDPFIA